MPAQTLNTICLIFLTVVAAAGSLWIAQDLFAPIVAALVLGIVCAPITDWIENWGLPRSVAAFLTLSGFIAIVLLAFLLIEPTVSSAMRNAPLIWREVTEFLEEVRRTLAGLEELQSTVNEALTEGAAASSGGTQTSNAAPVEVPGVMEALAYAPSVAAAVMIFIGTLYFFLVARMDAYARMSRFSEALTKNLFCRAETRVSRYFLTITVINAVFGVLVGLVLAWIGLANPMLWGLAAFLLNFVLYLGPVVFAFALFIGGIVQFEGAISFLPAALYVAMNLTEGQFVTPALVGRHMKVNPLLVFLSLVFWLWLWGPIGGVVAIPFLVWTLFLVGELRDPAHRQRSVLLANGQPTAAE